MPGPDDLKRKRQEVADMLGIPVEAVGDRTVRELATPVPEVDQQIPSEQLATEGPGAVVQGRVPTTLDEERRLAADAIERDLNPQPEFAPQEVDPLNAPVDASLGSFKFDQRSGQLEPVPDVVSGAGAFAPPDSQIIDAGAQTIQVNEELQDAAEVAAVERQHEEEARARAEGYVRSGMSPGQAEALALQESGFNLYLSAINDDLEANAKQREAQVGQLDAREKALRKAAEDRDAVLQSFAIRASAMQERTDELRQALREGKVNTGRSVGSKIFMAIALALSGGLAALQNRPNEMLRLVAEKERVRVEAEEANINKIVQELRLAGADEAQLNAEKNLALAELKNDTAMQYEIAAAEFQRQMQQKVLPQKDMATAKRMVGALLDKAAGLQGEARKQALEEAYKLAQINKLMAETGKLNRRGTGGGSAALGTGAHEANVFGLNRNVDFKKGITDKERQDFRAVSSARARVANIMKEIIVLQEEAGRSNRKLAGSRFQPMIQARIDQLKFIAKDEGRDLRGAGANLTVAEIEMLEKGFAINDQGWFVGADGAVERMKGTLRDLSNAQAIQERTYLTGDGIGKFGNTFTPITATRPQKKGTVKAFDFETGERVEDAPDALSETWQFAAEAETPEDAVGALSALRGQAEVRKEKGGLGADPNLRKKMLSEAKRLVRMTEGNSAANNVAWEMYDNISTLVTESEPDFKPPQKKKKVPTIQFSN